METMAIPEQFSLRWNDFYSNLSQSFQTFLAGEDLVDVTLAVDGQYFHAHKLILSVCSPYFKELFKMNPCEHPIVFLKDVTHHELHQLIQFMYRGEVHVRQQELSGFLHTAELLQVKGLTGSRERSESPSPVTEEPPETKSHQPLYPSENQSEWAPSVDDHVIEQAVEPQAVPVIKEETPRSPLKRLLKDTMNKNNYSNKKKNRTQINDTMSLPENSDYVSDRLLKDTMNKNNYSNKIKNRTQINDTMSLPENSDYASDSEPLIDFDNDLKILHHHSDLVLPKGGKESGWHCKTGGVKCPSCHRIFANRYNLKVHIRDKHDTREGTLQCEICHKHMRNPSCLRVHMYHHRKQAQYLTQLSTAGDLGLSRLDQCMVGVKVEQRFDQQTPSVDFKHESQRAGDKIDWRPDAQSSAAEFADTDPVEHSPRVLNPEASVPHATYESA